MDNSPTEQRIEWLCRDEHCGGNTTTLECSDDIWTALFDEPPVFDLGGGTVGNEWQLMDPSGPTGQCVDLAYLMQRMYQLLGCGDGETGYVFPTIDATCYSTGLDPDTRTCPVHGAEELWFYSAQAGGWNRHEAVFHVNDVYYAVKEVKDADPFEIIKAIVSRPGNYQAWRYNVNNVWYTCTESPYPVPLPQE